MARLKLADGCRMPIDAFVQAMLRRAGVAVQALPLQWPAPLRRSIDASVISVPERMALLASLNQQLSRFKNLRRPLSAEICTLDSGSASPDRRHIGDEAYVVLDGVGMFAFSGAGAPVAGLALEVLPGDYVHIAADVGHRLMSADTRRLTAVRYGAQAN